MVLFDLDGQRLFLSSDDAAGESRLPRHCRRSRRQERSQRAHTVRFFFLFSLDVLLTLCLIRTVLGDVERAEIVTGLCRSLLTPEYGFHFVSVSAIDFVNKSVAEQIGRITPRLDVVFAVYPQDLRRLMPVMSGALFTHSTFEELSLALLVPLQRLVVSQMSLAVGLMPLLRASPGCRVLFNSNSLGSITEASSSTGFGARMTFAALSMFIKVLSVFLFAKRF